MDPKANRRAFFRTMVLLFGLHGGRRICSGTALQDLDCTSAMSELLIAPFTVTSSRKLLSVSACPDCDWVCAISLQLTAPFPVVSPTRTPIRITTSPKCEPILTPD